MKKTLLFLSTILVLIALTVSVSVFASEEDVIHSGTWGDLNWTLNETTGELTISGTGAMNDLNVSSTDADAWRAHRASIQTVVIEDGVTSVGDHAFDGCSKLTSITIPDSVTSIGYCTFSGCSKLKSITIPDSVTSIGRYAFSECISLTSITIPDSVTSMAPYAFYGCQSIKDVYISDVESWLNIERFDNSYYPNCYGTLHIIDENGNEITELVIPNSVTNIGSSAFENCTGLTSITIPDSVESIGGVHSKIAPV